MAHLSTEQLAAGVDNIKASPTDNGTVELVLRRPETNERELVESIQLEPGAGIVGDNFVARGNSKTPDGAADPQAQICLMNSRALDLVADGNRELWPLAGDQIIVDFDLSALNVPAGTQLEIGSAVVEVSVNPHNGCAKFAQRFGLDAAKWVNSDKDMRFRGINVMVVSAGEVAAGDSVTQLETSGLGTFPLQASS